MARARVALLFTFAACGAGVSSTPISSSNRRVARADELLATVAQTGRTTRRGGAVAEFVTTAIFGIYGGAILANGSLDGTSSGGIETSAAIGGGLAIAVAALTL